MNDKDISLDEFLQMKSGSVLEVTYGKEVLSGAMIQKRNKGIDSSIHIRQPNFFHTAVERMYKIHDPTLTHIRIVRQADWSKRAKLYYIRDNPKQAKSGYK